MTEEQAIAPCLIQVALLRYLERRFDEVDREIAELVKEDIPLRKIRTQMKVSHDKVQSVVRKMGRRTDYQQGSRG